MEGYRWQPHSMGSWELSHTPPARPPAWSTGWLANSQVDEALKELSAFKGPGCGARLAGKSDQVDLAPAILRLRMDLAAAVEQERCGGGGGGTCAGCKVGLGEGDRLGDSSAWRSLQRMLGGGRPAARGPERKRAPVSRAGPPGCQNPFVPT